MKTYRKTATIAGILFLAGYLSIFLGSAIYAPYVDPPDYLSLVFPNKNQVVLGMFVELINDVAVIGLGIALYPVLKKYCERLAIGYLGLRLIESVLLIASKTGLLSLIPLSEKYLEAGSPAKTHFEIIGATILSGRFWASQIQVVFFCLSALIFYWVMYRTKLIPKFLSAWGFFAVAALIAANLLPVPDLTDGFSVTQLLFMPIFISEIVVALWLIFKGFSKNETILAAKPES